jgi:hypothetical protein
VSGQLHAPAALLPGTHWLGGWLDIEPFWTIWRIEHSLPLPGIELNRSVVQPVASRCTDYATAAQPDTVNCCISEPNIHAPTLAATETAFNAMFIKQLGPYTFCQSVCRTTDTGGSSKIR